MGRILVPVAFAALFCVGVVGESSNASTGRVSAVKPYPRTVMIEPRAQAFSPLADAHGTDDFGPVENEAHDEQFQQYGIASWYDEWHHGRLTASGVPFDMHSLTAAHRTLPLGTTVRVTNLDNGRMVDVLINDRGPYIRGRVIDLSRRAASELAMIRDGIVPVKIEEVAPVQTASGAPERPRTLN